MKLLIVALVFIFTKITPTTAQCKPNGTAKSTSLTEYFEWQYIDFNWPNATARSSAISSKTYVPGNCIICDVTYFNRYIYVALPKFKTGCPATVGSFSIDVSNKTNTPINTYPDWATNTGSNCEALQNVGCIETSLTGKLWVLDAMREDASITTCPAKLQTFNLLTHQKIDEIILAPNACISCAYCSMALDPINNYTAYMLDCSRNNYGLLVLLLTNQTYYRVLQADVMNFNNNYNTFVVNGGKCSGDIPISGLALTPAFYQSQPERYLYFTTGNDASLYKINTFILRNEILATTGDFDCFVRYVGELQGPSNAMIFDTTNTLYYGVFTTNSLDSWSLLPPNINESNVTQSNEFIWPDSFTFDVTGTMFVLVNNKCAFLNNLLNNYNINFRILSFHTGTCDYQTIINTMN